MLLLLLVAAACGSALADHDGFVINGKLARQGQFPYAAKISRCSASILDSRTILTAAHCVCKSKPTYVLVGSVNSNRPESGSQRYDLDTSRQSVLRWKCGGTNNRRDDLAILKTRKAISFNRNVGPVSLASSNPRNGASIRVVGYGRDEKGNSRVLRYADNKVSSCSSKNRGAVCQPATPNTPHSGDSGGPSFVNGRQVGVVSGGSSRTATYASVGENIKWIRARMG